MQLKQLKTNLRKQPPSEPRKARTDWVCEKQNTCLFCNILRSEHCRNTPNDGLLKDLLGFPSTSIIPFRDKNKLTINAIFFVGLGSRAGRVPPFINCWAPGSKIFGVALVFVGSKWLKIGPKLLRSFSSSWKLPHYLNGSHSYRINTQERIADCTGWNIFGLEKLHSH